MAIAPLPIQEQFDLLEIPWPKPDHKLAAPAAPRLRLVEAPVEEPVAIRQGFDIAERRARREAAMWRRRLVLGAVVAVALLAALAVPVQALGGSTISGRSAATGVEAGLPDGSLYVVQEGDTLASIAHRMDPVGDQAALVAALRKTVGSSVVVPGERIVLP